MKALFVFVLLALSSASFASKSVYCESFEDDNASGVRQNGETVSVGDIGNANRDDYALFVYDKLRLPCKDKQGKKYIIAMDGIGPGLRYVGAGSAVVFSCPLVRKSKFVGTYGGAKFSIGDVFAGVKVAVVSNKRLGVCFLAGFDLMSVGASVSIGKLEVVEQR